MAEDKRTDLILDLEPVRSGYGLRDLTVHNITGFWRYLRLRLRFRQLQSGLFYIGPGADILIDPSAQVHFGKNVRFMRDFTARFRGQVTIGDHVFFNRSCHVVAQHSLSIGSNCLFGEMVSIHDENHVIELDAAPRRSRGLVAAPIVIEDNVWVGAKATILAGVHIGDNTVIAANAVVTRDIPAGVVAAGVPARVVREL